jgi:hypothetical protein
MNEAQIAVGLGWASHENGEGTPMAEESRAAVEHKFSPRHIATTSNAIAGPFRGIGTIRIELLC